MSEKEINEKEIEQEEEGEEEDYKRDHKGEQIAYFKKMADKEISVPGFKEIMYSLLKQLTIGMDLTKVMLPVEFCENRTLLEKLTDIMSHIDFMMALKEDTNPETRMVELCRWMCSGWYVRAPGPKKPYNPILGEIFRGHWSMEDGSISTYFAEQVSHHPPVTAFFGENKHFECEMEGFYHPQSRFFGNSVGALADGYANITFKKFNEVYKVDWPDYYFRGLVWGTLRMEVGGSVKLSCEQTGWSANIKFCQKPTFGGEWNCIEGKIFDPEKKTRYYLSGKWNDEIFIQSKVGKRKKSEKKLFFKAWSTPTCPMQFISEKALTEWESHRVWKKLTQAVNEGDLQKSRDAKFEVEEAQRERRREREKKKVTHEPRFFKKTENGFWKFKGKDEDMYKVLLEKKLP